jgi:DNA-binding response OmpR family regulator/EAL domain-containing protein (putative c-di-GMP-specific phosphodiesterase class I)/HPt (histidine-containing phosphotransfer) domain-containing protein
MPNESYEQQLAELKREYIDALPGKLKDIKSAWEHLQYVNWDNKKLDKLKFVSHELVGVGANLGFPNISTSAKLLDEQLRTVKSNADPDERSQITAHLAQLQKAINHAVKSYHSKSETHEVPALSETITTKGASIAIIEDDKSQADLLKLKLQLFGYTVETFNCPNTFSKDQNTTHFDLIILDVSFPDGPLEGLFWLERIHEQLPTHCPIIITSARSDFVARMRAVRAGASAYIAKPLDIDDVNKQISYCLKQQNASEILVLCVDDDIQQQKLYKILLSNESFIYEGLTQPLKIIESMESFQPDIIIMDYEMPGCNGGEIAAMLRQDIRFMTIPIIFASGSTKAIENNEQLSILGNAFLKKPFDQQDLLAQIKAQLSRAKYISRKIEQVSQRIDKHGLQTKRFFLEKLETLLYQNSLPNEKVFLVYATIDNIDYLKERFGLRRLANINTQLENYLASHNLVKGNGCNIGNASFLMLVYLEKSEDERETLCNFQQTIGQLSWPVDDKTCKLTLSMGVLELQQSNNLDEIITKIEKACFDGVSAGGNRVDWVKSVQKKQDILDDKIKSLMREQSFKLYYQPIVNLETDVVLFEALLRLVNQEGHIFSPDQFMPWIDSEFDGGSNTLDSWLIEQAVTEINQVSQEHNQATTIIVKLASSLSQIVGLLPEIRFAIQKYKMNDHGQLIFALPISSVIKDIKKSKQIIESLKELGCGFMLEKVEPTEAHIKLLHEIGKINFAKLKVSENNAKQLKKFISHVQKANKNTPIFVASGIEDSTMLAQYWELGIRNFQGYFIQKPGEESIYKANDV